LQELELGAKAFRTAQKHVVKVGAPFHATADGDTLFAVSTASESELKKREKSRVDEVSVLAGGLMQEAVLNAAQSN
jgi:L-aminopeptidase/D-esterase-like protein